MGQVLLGSATTTEAVRRAIQHSQASLRELARRRAPRDLFGRRRFERRRAVDLRQMKHGEGAH